MLTFEEKIKIIEENFPQLQKKEVSLGRVNYHYEESISDKKNVIYHLHPNGNGYVYAGLLDGYPTEKKGMVNIRDYSVEELKDIVQKSIDSLSPDEEDKGESYWEEWVNDDHQMLVLMKEEDMWNVYADLDLDGTFNSYGEATEYLHQEGFSQA